MLLCALLHCERPVAAALWQGLVIALERMFEFVEVDCFSAWPQQRHRAQAAHRFIAVVYIR